MVYLARESAYVRSYYQADRSSLDPAPPSYRSRPANENAADDGSGEDVDLDISDLDGVYTLPDFNVGVPLRAQPDVNVLHDEEAPSVVEYARVARTLARSGTTTARQTGSDVK